MKNSDMVETILIIGGSGFIGKALCEYLANEKINVIAAVRVPPARPVDDVNYVITGDYNNYTDWTALLQECNGVVFAAGLAHSKDNHKMVGDILKLNSDLPFEIAKCAVCLNIKKFIFLSSIKVNGELSEDGKPFGLDSKPAPFDVYAKSKLDAEEKLNTLVGNKTEISIIRLPLVVGALAKGNVGLIQMLVRSRIPIPASNLNFNSRSIVLLQDVCTVVHQMFISKDDVTGTHFIKYYKNVSTKELIQLIGTLEKRRPILFSLPLTLLRSLLTVLRLDRLKTQLFCNLEVEDNYPILNNQIGKTKPE